MPLGNLQSRWPISAATRRKRILYGLDSIRVRWAKSQAVPFRTSSFSRSLFPRSYRSLFFWGQSERNRGDSMELEVRVVGGIESCFVSLPLPFIHTLESTRGGFLPSLLALELRSRSGDHWNVPWSGSASKSSAIEVLAVLFVTNFGMIHGTWNFCGYFGLGFAKEVVFPCALLFEWELFRSFLRDMKLLSVILIAFLWFQSAFYLNFLLNEYL